MQASSKNPITSTMEMARVSTQRIGLAMTILVIVLYLGDILTNWQGAIVDYTTAYGSSPDLLVGVIIVLFTTAFAFVEKFAVFLFVFWGKMLKSGPKNKGQMRSSLEFHSSSAFMVVLLFTCIVIFLYDVTWTQYALRQLFPDRLSLIVSFAINIAEFVLIFAVEFNGGGDASVVNPIKWSDYWLTKNVWNMGKFVLTLVAGVALVYIIGFWITSQSGSVVELVMPRNAAGAQNIVIPADGTQSLDTTGGGQTLQQPTVAAPVVNGTCAQWYSVQTGDTLSRIARTYNWNVSDLASRNNIINPNLLSVGQQVCVRFN